MNKFFKSTVYNTISSDGRRMIYQIFFPEVMGAHSGYGVAVGWQRN